MPDQAYPVLERMIHTLAHRGPDGRKEYRSGNVGMIHNRLAIIDLETGDQPLSEPGGAALVGAGVVVLGTTLALPVTWVVAAGVLSCTGLRLFAIRRGWKLPVARPPN